MQFVGYEGLYVVGFVVDDAFEGFAVHDQGYVGVWVVVLFEGAGVVFDDQCVVFVILMLNWNIRFRFAVALALNLDCMVWAMLVIFMVLFFFRFFRAVSWLHWVEHDFAE